MKFTGSQAFGADTGSFFDAAIEFMGSVLSFEGWFWALDAPAATTAGAFPLVGLVRMGSFFLELLTLGLFKANE
jgi:hypothetical protein